MVIHTKDVNVAKVYQAFLYTRGDIERTAALGDASPLVVKQLALEHSWSEDLQSLSLRPHEDDEDAQRKFNRSRNLLQAERVQAILDRVIDHLTDTDKEGFEGFFSTVDKKGQAVPSMKPMAELAKAVEIVQNLTYVAAGDKSSLEKLTADSKTRLQQMGLEVGRAIDALMSGTAKTEKAVEALDVSTS